MVAPTTSYPSSTSTAAATELSTPPDIATSTRSVMVRQPNAEWGMRNAESMGKVRSAMFVGAIDDGAMHSAFRTPHSALPSPVQHRAQRSHLLHNLGEHRDRRVHVFGARVVTERESQGGDAQLPRHAQRREHVRRLDRPRAARRARGAGDAGEVE